MSEDAKDETKEQQNDINSIKSDDESEIDEYYDDISMANDDFREHQRRWMNRLRKNTKLLNAKFAVGKDKQIMYGLRSLLSNISKVFDKQFNSDGNKNNYDSVIEYPNITPDVFECILRASFCLDPGFTPDNVVPLLIASKTLRIKGIEIQCMKYLHESLSVDNVLSLLNSLYQNHRLTSRYFNRCELIILKNAATIIGQNSFKELHPDIMVYLLSHNCFNVKEEDIFTKCVEWSNNCIRKYGSGFTFTQPNNEQLPILDMNTTHLSLDSNRGQYKWMHIINEYIRYPLMAKEFFVDTASEYLTWEQQRSVFVYFTLSDRLSQIFSHSEREKEYFINKDKYNITKSSHSNEHSHAQNLKEDNDTYWPQSKWKDNELFWASIEFNYKLKLKCVYIYNLYDNNNDEQPKSITLYIAKNDDEISSDDDYKNNDKWIEYYKNDNLFKRDNNDGILYKLNNYKNNDIMKAQKYKLVINAAFGNDCRPAIKQLRFHA